MPRTAIYYHDYQTPHQRKRLMVMPAISSPPRDVSNAPAWGAAPAEGVTNWIQLPPGILKSGSSGEAGYDELPIGCPDPPTRTFKFDLQSCVGNSDWEDFIDYLLTPVLIGEGEYTPGGSTWTFDVVNVFSLTSDLGNSALAVASFATEYMGVQERKTEEELDLVELTNRESGTKTVVRMTYEAATTHLALWALQTVKPATIAGMMMSYMGDPYPTKTTEAAYYIWEKAADNAVYGIRYGTDPRPLFGFPQQRFIWFTYSGLWDAITYAVGTLLSANIGTVATMRLSIASGYTSDIGPLGVLKLYKRNLSDLSDAYTGSPAESEAHFCGLVYFDGEPSEYVGGWLLEGFAEYETLWDFLKASCESFGARLLIQHDSPYGEMTLFFEGMLDAQRVSNVSIGDATGQTKLVVRKSLIAGAECDVARASSGDVQTVTVQEWGTMEDAKRSVPSTHHNSILIGDVNDSYYLNTLVDDSWNTIFPTKEVLLTGKPTLPDSLLVYFDEPAWASEEIALIYHRYVGVRTSDSTTRTDCTNGLPSNLPTPSVWTSPFDVLWSPLRLLLLDTHWTSGIPYAVTKAIAATFSKWNQIGVTLNVPPTQAILNDLGSVADIDLATFAGGLLSIAARDPFITAITSDESAAEVQLIAPGG